MSCSWRASLRVAPPCARWSYGPSAQLPPWAPFAKTAKAWPKLSRGPWPRSSPTHAPTWSYSAGPDFPPMPPPSGRGAPCPSSSRWRVASRWLRRSFVWISLRAGRESLLLRRAISRSTNDVPPRSHRLRSARPRPEVAGRRPARAPDRHELRGGRRALHPARGQRVRVLPARGGGHLAASRRPQHEARGHLRVSEPRGVLASPPHVRRAQYSHHRLCGGHGPRAPSRGGRRPRRGGPRGDESRMAMDRLSVHG